MAYNEEDMLMLSGIQHFMFCPRQWALIHMEQQWDDNRLTIEGELLHKHVDDPAYRQKNGDTLTLRAVSIASGRLGLYGITDAVELLPAADDEPFMSHPRYPGRWKPYPIEYKRGHEKTDERDEVQLAAQVMCLEEMYGIRIPRAALYYGETRRRVEIPINDALRALTTGLAEEMHHIYSLRRLPAATRQPHCRNCSLSNICMPETKQCGTVRQYLKSNLYEEIT